MRIAVIACKVMQRELSYLVSRTKNVCSLFWLEQGLHETPGLLKQSIQQQIDFIDEIQRYAMPSKKFDAIVLGYGLCSSGIEGVCAQTLPLIVPKTDDCIALFLGSQKRYLEYFNRYKGIYWYNPGWIELGNVPSREYYEERLVKYTEQYGEDNALYLMEAENGWHTNYQNCIYITSSVVDDAPYLAFTQAAAQQIGWNCIPVQGDLSLLHNLIEGNWNETDFLSCPAEYRVVLTYESDKIKAEK